MIYYLTHKKHSYTIRAYLDTFAPELKERILPLAYQKISRPLPGTYIFADVERLNGKHTLHAMRLWSTLLRAGYNLLNHPRRSMRRYRLLKTLHRHHINAFNVFRPWERLWNRLNYPVFIRGRHLERPH